MLAGGNDVKRREVEMAKTNRGGRRAGDGRTMSVDVRFDLLCLQFAPEP